MNNRYSDIDIIQYIYLNFFSKHIKRLGKGRVVPHKHVVLEFGKNSYIQIENGWLELGTDRVKGSKQETCIRLGEDSIWINHNGGGVSAGSFIDIKKEACLDTDLFTISAGGVIICAHSITIGHDVMIGRNACIYDSDFHALIVDDEISNADIPVIIGNHVWLAKDVTILKGVEVKDGTVIAAGCLVRSDVPEAVLMYTKNDAIHYRHNVKWRRQK